MKGGIHKLRGAFIVIEGCDRAGKSTQATMLVDQLLQRGEKVDFRRYPDRKTLVGQLIDSYLRQASNLDDRAIHLLFSANRWESVPSLLESLNQGNTLIVDRYAYSGVAFTAAKGLDLEWCKQPDVGLPEPDMVIFLDLPIEEAEKRGDFGSERYETREFQKQVYENFLKLRDNRWKFIDARHSIHSIQEQIQHLVQQTIESVSTNTSPLSHLWSKETTIHS